MKTETAQLDFDALLRATDRENEIRQQEKLYGQLPGTMDEAVPYFQALIERHHAAMVDGDPAAVMTLREEAGQLAVKLNNYEAGILADDDAPGCVLNRLTAAEQGATPLWGQSGEFEIVSGRMRVIIEMDGIFGIGSAHMHWLGFAAHAAEWDQPFLSETGYRSFFGVGGALQPGYTPDAFAAQIVAAHVRRELKGKLVAIKRDSRPEAMGQADA